MDGEAMLQVNCPACRNAVGIDDDLPTSEWECPSCQAAFRVRTATDGTLQGKLMAEESAIQTGEPSHRRKRYEAAETPAYVSPREPTGIDTFDHLSDEEGSRELANGGKFIVYSYCISILVLTFTRPSAVHFVRNDESRFVKGLPYTMISLILGWWGFPFGIIYTIWCIISNSAGGTDVTAEMLHSVPQQHNND
jgi:hypothetical protein